MSANLSDTSFWKPAYSNVGTQQVGNTAMPSFQDFSPILKKMSYQLSTALPESQDSSLKPRIIEPMDHHPSIPPSISITGTNGLSSIITTPNNSSIINTTSDAANHPRSTDRSKQSIIASPGGNSAQRNSSTDLICRRLGIDSIQLVTWMENLRMWISQTIFARIVKEINQTNSSTRGTF